MAILKGCCAALLAFSLFSCDSSEKQDKKEAAAVSKVFKLEKYDIGQIWNFNAPKGDDSATITILKVERTEKGDTIIHVRLDNIRVYNPEIKEKFTRNITHLPFSRQALDSSVTTLKGQTAEVPEYLNGYLKWKDAYDRNEGGYWKLSAVHVLDQMNKIMYERYK